MDLPHVLDVTVLSAKDLNSTNVFLSPAPSAYVVVNAIRSGRSKRRSSCYSTAKTSVVSSNHHPQWNEDIHLTIEGAGALTFNVFSHSMFSGETFLGQAAVDLSMYPAFYSDESVQLTLPLGLNNLA